LVKENIPSIYRQVGEAVGRQLLCARSQVVSYGARQLLDVGCESG
jgi:hypothetical protein